MAELLEEVEGALEDLKCDLKDGTPCGTCLGDAVGRLKLVRRELTPYPVGVEAEQAEEVWF